MTALLAIEIPLSLYVHLPWCIRKCPYCDFNSYQTDGSIPEDQYIEALLTDLQRQVDAVKGRTIISVFIGGGTPSLFSARSIQRLLAAIHADLWLADDAEITIEANPDSLDQQNFTGFRRAGVNRISIGAQSFHNDLLRRLGRIHDAQAALDAVSTARAAGFENINIDLMYALPEQTLQAAGHDVQQAVSLHPAHISYYQLTIEPDTHFYRHRPRLPDDELGWEMQRQGVELLAQHGFRQYEVSAYARDSFACVHNRNYWRFGDYIGIGAGAHQKISDMKKGVVLRSEKPRHPRQYMRQILAGEPLKPPRVLDERDVQFEFLLNALRLQQGFSPRQFERHTGLDYASLHPQLEPLLEEDLLTVENGHVQCSKQGYRFLDELLQGLLPEYA